MINLSKSRKLILIGIVVGIILLARPFDWNPFGGGWEIEVSAKLAKVENSSWINTSPSQWQHDFDSRYSGAPDLVIDAGMDPVHVDKYFNPSPKDVPAFAPIEKEKENSIFLYDVHLYRMDITLRTDGDYRKEEDPGSNSIESESSYSHDRAGDGGSHTFTVRFQLNIESWEKFANEADSWAGVMSIFTYTAPTVGVQPYDTRDLRSGLDYDFKGDYTSVSHNPFPASQGSQLNMWLEDFSQNPKRTVPTIAPDSRIPSSVYFDLGCDFRAGALIGEDGWGNEEDIYILDPFVIFHVAFELLTVHEFYLESEPVATITQETPVPSGVPGIAEGVWYQQITDWVNTNFALFGGLEGLVVIILVAVVVIALGPTLMGAIGIKKRID